jgi:hypothetical protein
MVRGNRLPAYDGRNLSHGRGLYRQSAAVARRDAGAFREAAGAGKVREWNGPPVLMREGHG